MKVGILGVDILESNPSNHDNDKQCHPYNSTAKHVIDLKLPMSAAFRHYSGVSWACNVVILLDDHIRS